MYDTAKGAKDSEGGKADTAKRADDTKGGRRTLRREGRIVMEGRRGRGDTAKRTEDSEGGRGGEGRGGEGRIVLIVLEKRLALIG